MPKDNGELITIPWDSDKARREKTVMCRHCGRHWIIKHAFERASLGKLGFCHRCNGITCGESCQECVPMEQQLENMEACLPEHMIRTHRPVRVGDFHGTGDIWA